MKGGEEGSTYEIDHEDMGRRLAWSPRLGFEDPARGRGIPPRKRANSHVRSSGIGPGLYEPPIDRGLNERKDIVQIRQDHA